MTCQDQTVLWHEKDQRSISPTCYGQLLHTKIPKVQKVLSVFFHFLDLRVKAARKMLVKSTPAVALSGFTMQLLLYGAVWLGLNYSDKKALHICGHNQGKDY